MFGYLILLFTLLPALELYVLIEIGGHIGAGNTILIIIFTGILGAYLARLQGFLAFKKIQDNLNRGVMPSSELIDGVMILVGGIVLLTPGFITDTIGFLLLIPITRSLIKAFLKSRFEHAVKTGQATSYSSINQTNKRYDDIDI